MKNDYVFPISRSGSVAVCMICISHKTARVVKSCPPCMIIPMNSIALDSILWQNSVFNTSRLKVSNHKKSDKQNTLYGINHFYEMRTCTPPMKPLKQTKRTHPRRGFEPWSTAWQARILTSRPPRCSLYQYAIYSIYHFVHCAVAGKKCVFFLFMKLALFRSFFSGQLPFFSKLLLYSTW